MFSKIKIIFFLNFLIFSSQAQKIVRVPYLQQPTQSNIIIRWRTDIPTIGKVTYFKNENSPVLSKQNPNLTTEHVVQLTDLEADTKYFYAVGTNEKELLRSKDHYFNTAPKADTKRPIRFWAMGDFGDLSTEKYIQNQTNVRNQYLKNKKGQTDLWLWLGDNTYCCGFDAEFQKQVFDFYGNEIFGNTPIMPAVGNHEYYATSTGQIDRKIPYFDIISVPTQGEAGGLPSGTKAYYSYNYGNIHFIALDSYGMDDGKYILADKASKQYQWLEKDLEANKTLWTVVYLHHPPYTKRSHDSDAEPDLKAVREALVPIFDKYKVDLVLSGHSHVYERSFLIKNHTGHSEGFDRRIFVVQDTEARYEKNSKPIINKTDGTIYMVVGSAGRIDWNGQFLAHPTSAYSNYDMGGSLVLTIDENRLDGEWICADGQIRDKFTVFKNVNKIERKTIEFGSKTNLSASWEGTYVWSNGVKNQPNIEVSPRKDTLFTVGDSLGFIMDKFEISVLPQPKIITSLATNEVICSGREIKVGFEISNTNLEKWTYSLELSDKNGSFAKPLVLANGKTNTFSIMLPDTLSEGDNYRLRVHSNADFFEEIPSNSFKIFHASEGQILNPSPIPFETTTTLKVQLKGSPPFNLKISNLPEQKTDKLLNEIIVNQSKSATYEIESLSNTCGFGKIIGSKVVILEPLSNEEESRNFTIFPNPTNSIIFIENLNGKTTKTKIIIRDLSGKKLLEKTSYFETKEVISLETLPDGIYLIELKNRNGKWSRKIVKE